MMPVWAYMASFSFGYVVAKIGGDVLEILRLRREIKRVEQDPLFRAFTDERKQKAREN